jgi:hypothetical protein
MSSLGTALGCADCTARCPQHLTCLQPPKHCSYCNNYNNNDARKRKSPCFAANVTTARDVATAQKSGNAANASLPQQNLAVSMVSTHADFAIGSKFGRKKSSDVMMWQGLPLLPLKLGENHHLLPLRYPYPSSTHYLLPLRCL